MTRPASAGAPTEAAIRAVATDAMMRAYAPYSRFRVGAALLGADDSLHVGCNVENAAYPAGICAERAALAAAVSAGVRQFRLLVVATDADDPTPPCGMCRQALVEFAPDLSIVSVTRGGGEARWALSSLLPHPFGPAALTHR